MEATLTQRRQIIEMAVRHRRFVGVEFKSGVINSALANSVWSRNKDEFLDIVEREIDAHELPIGIEMPWGMVIKP